MVRIYELHSCHQSNESDQKHRETYDRNNISQSSFPRTCCCCFCFGFSFGGKRWILKTLYIPRQNILFCIFPYLLSHLFWTQQWLHLSDPFHLSQYIRKSELFDYIQIYWLTNSHWAEPIWMCHYSTDGSCIAIAFHLEFWSENIV